MPYKYIVPQILCEPYLADHIIDYKFFCCNGKVTFINIGQKNYNTHMMHVTFLDYDWKPLPFQRSDNPPMEKLPPRPKQLDKMIALAEKLANGRRFLPVDFYLVDDHIYFSEYTLCPTSGLIQFDLQEGDIILGKKLIL